MAIKSKKIESLALCEWIFGMALDIADPRVAIYKAIAIWYDYHIEKKGVLHAQTNE